MRAIVFESPGSARMADTPLPAPQIGQVRLRVVLAGICSTDLHIFQGHFPVKTPRVLGHEIVGLVEAVGEQVAPEWLGKVCGVCPATFCGACAACRQGLFELCERFECLGNTQDGGFAEYTLVNAGQLVPIGDLKPEIAIWMEPLACVLHAIEAAQVDGEGCPSVLVLGAGVLGRLMIQALSITTHARTAVSDPNPDKIDQARALGAEQGWVIPRSGQALEIDAAIRRWAPGGLQAIIDTSGAPLAIQNALAWAGAGCRVVLFGVSDPAARLSISPQVIFQKELWLTAAAGMTPATFDRSKDLLLAGRLDPSRLVSRVIDLDEVPLVLQGSRLARSGKVLVRPGAGRP